ncbi:MAG: alginate export family protein, partial [Nitrospinaceae bacterium]
MKRNFLTLVAMMVSVLFVGTTIAEAADIKWGGQMRPRIEISTKDHNPNTSADVFFNQRTRLNANVSINDTTSAFIQFQSANEWGQADVPGLDTDASVGLHQSYLTLKNLYGAPVDARIGKQEVVLDGHRLFGHTGWREAA